MTSPTDPTPPSSENPRKSRREPIREATEKATGFAWVVGKRARWIVIGLWIVAAMAASAFQLPAKFAEAQVNDQRNFLPADAESTKVADQVKAITKVDSVPFVAVVNRPGGLKPTDRAAITGAISRFNAQPASAKITVRDPKTRETRSVTLRDTVSMPRGRLALGGFSKNGTTALVVGAVKVTGDTTRLIDSIDALRSGLTPLQPTGLTVKVTGAAGFSYDAAKQFGGLDASLLISAVVLVTLLLVVIYRSPILLWVPLFAVMLGELLTQSLGYLTTKVGVTITGQSTGIMSVLVLGAGTDYALLVTARYREELRHHANRHDALRLAMRSAGPAVFASGLTVAAGLLTLTVASVKGTAGLGPVGAIAVGVAMLAMLTLLPALFAVLPRRVFWPRTPLPGSEGGDATHGAFRRIGERVAVRPRRTWVITSLALLLCIAGLTQFSTQVSQSSSFLGTVESVEGSKILGRSFPSGDGNPTQVVVPASGNAKAAVARLEAVKGVASAGIAAQGPEGTLINVTLTKDPLSTEAQELIVPIRAAARAGGGPGTTVGGATAIQEDLATANEHDLRLIIPLVLAVVLLILMGLLRSLVFPLVLIGTVVLSFAATLGLTSILWTNVLGFEGADRAIVLYSFVFLVALGIDYNIFLASRIREEALRHGTREGVLRALGATGGVITAAGIVLAGTFLVLASTPILFLVETGTAVALGVLLDTFIVRSILAPALALDLGDRIWWPWTTKQLPASDDES